MSEDVVDVLYIYLNILIKKRKNSGELYLEQYKYFYQRRYSKRNAERGSWVGFCENRAISHPCVWKKVVYLIGQFRDASPCSSISMSRSLAYIYMAYLCMNVWHLHVWMHAHLCMWVLWRMCAWCCVESQSWCHTSSLVVLHLSCGVSCLSHQSLGAQLIPELRKWLF